MKRGVRHSDRIEGAGEGVGGRDRLAEAASA